MPPQINSDKSHENNNQDQTIGNTESSASEQFKPCHENCQEIFFLTKFTFEELLATRRLQSEWVYHCTETNSMQEAIAEGNLDNVKWIWGKKANWDEYEGVKKYLSLAAEKGHFEVLKWLHEVKCPEEKNTCWGGKNVMSMAALFGSLEMMRWLKEKGYKFDRWTFRCASKNGNLDNLKWLKENGCSWFICADNEMVRHGSLKNIIWAKENGMKFSRRAYVIAAGIGNMKIMQWLKDDGIPMNAECFEAAAQRGDMEMMKWLEENNCPWNEETYKAAVCYGRQMLSWLKEKGCPSS